MTDLNPASSDLQRAYALIQSDNLTAARDLLDDYLITHPNDPDAWWLYAHAVTDADEAQNALETVLRLRPDYPGASELLEESQELLVFSDDDFDDEPFTTESVVPAATMATPSVDTVETPAVTNETPAARATSTRPTTSSGMQRPVFLVAAIIVALLLIGLAVILANQAANNPSTNPTLSPVATSIAQVTNTASSTAEIVAGVTDEATAAGTEAAEYDALYAALAEFDVVEDSVVTEDAAIGQTVLVSVCNDAATGLRNTSIDALTALASSSPSLEAAGPEFIGIRVLDCQRNNFVLRTLAVAFADAEAYANGEISVADLTSRLVVIS